MRQLIRILVLSVLLTACATRPPPPGPVSDDSHQLWQQRQQQLSRIDHWSIRGRVALYVNDEVYNLGLGWIRQQDKSVLKLEAALGQGMIQITRHGSGVELTTAEGERYYGDNAEQVLRQSTGWSIPVEGLQSWIMGINHTGSYYLPDIDEQGRAASLRQDNWQINYLQYDTAELNRYEHPVLPRMLYMKRQNLALKIVIDQWQPPPALPDSGLFPSFPD